LLQLASSWRRPAIARRSNHTRTKKQKSSGGHLPSSLLEPPLARLSHRTRKKTKAEQNADLLLFLRHSSGQSAPNSISNLQLARVRCERGKAWHARAPAEHKRRPTSGQCPLRSRHPNFFAVSIRVASHKNHTESHTT